jgi:hypothetical protein
MPVTAATVFSVWAAARRHEMAAASREHDGPARTGRPAPTALHLTAAIRQAAAHLPQPYRAELEYVLDCFSNVIAADPFDLGKSTVHTHNITLRDREPVYTKQYPLRADEIQKIRHDVHEWLRIGIIEPANSPYNSPIFCVKKKDGGLRVVLDYRKVNAKSLPDRYSIRGVDECIREVGFSSV